MTQRQFRCELGQSRGLRMIFVASHQIRRPPRIQDFSRLLLFALLFLFLSPLLQGIPKVFPANNNINFLIRCKDQDRVNYRESTRRASNSNQPAPGSSQSPDSFFIERPIVVLRTKRSSVVYVSHASRQRFQESTSAQAASRSYTVASPLQRPCQRRLILVFAVSPRS